MEADPYPLCNRYGRGYGGILALPPVGHFRFKHRGVTARIWHLSANRVQAGTVRHAYVRKGAKRNHDSIEVRRDDAILTSLTIFSKQPAHSGASGKV
jgi:hypothetical protein